MPQIVLRNITKTFGKTDAVHDLDLVIEDGDFVTLLGPSGCGKTTTLRMIAGLETPTEGTISIGGKTVFSSDSGIDITPDKRDVGFLFQNYALWPHMTVEQNIGFGLENLKWSKDKIAQRVKELLTMLKIDGYQKRYPAELSGGQQQRVAIARTLATGPRVLLMDEPLSNLDAKLRTEMRAELKRLHKETGATFVYVTHDQLEAMTLSSKVCLLKDGLLQQYEPPMDVYHEPANMFVADFVGSPTMNFIDARAQNINLDQVKLEAEGLRMIFTPVSGSISLQNDQAVVLGVRPEYIIVADDSPVSAKVYSTLPSGMETILKLEAGTLVMTAVVFGSVDYQIDSMVKIGFSGNHCALFDKSSGAKLATGCVQLMQG